MEVKLIVCGGRNAGKEIPVTAPKFVIGRAEGCQLRPASDLVSRQHCEIVIEDGAAMVRDFDSRNGTFLNNEKVEKSRELKTGDRLKVGPLEFEVQLTVNVGGKKKPKVHNVHEAAARTVENAAPKGDDLDINDLLGEEDTSTTKGGHRGDTTTIYPGTLTPPPGAPAAPPTAPAGQAPGTPAVQKVTLTGRHAGAKKPTAANSREAAAEMLRKFLSGGHR